MIAARSSQEQCLTEKVPRFVASYASTTPLRSCSTFVPISMLPLGRQKILKSPGRAAFTTCSAVRRTLWPRHATAAPIPTTSSSPRVPSGSVPITRLAFTKPTECHHIRFRIASEACLSASSCTIDRFISLGRCSRERHSHSAASEDVWGRGAQVTAKKRRKLTISGFINSHRVADG